MSATGRAGRIGVVLALWCAGCSCESERDRPAPPDAGADAARAAVTAATPRGEPPELLYLPDGGDRAPEILPSPGPPPSGVPSGRCPAEMVDIRGSFCIDRFEARLADRVTGRLLSPYYHPTRYAVRREYERWQKRRLSSGTALGRNLPVPPPEDWQLSEAFEPMTTSQSGVVPSGYLSGVVADAACRAAGKRLCRAEEWIRACRGEADRQFPYGERYEAGRCNVDREAHPAGVLHGNPSINHLDPRLNLVEGAAGPLLRPTGQTAECVSRWGGDGVFDMVGNLDEWVDADGALVFQGGFYARGTREGCSARISSHAPEYLDYSLGVRCCL